MLIGEKVILRTDHRPLVFIRQGSENNRKLARWWAQLQEFDYEVEYVPGKINSVPDCMSRLTGSDDPTPVATLDHVVSVTSAFTTENLAADVMQDARCSRCGSGFADDFLECAGCGAKQHFDCAVSRVPQGLVFWYCENCSLDYRDPAMNLPLLMCLAEWDVDAIIAFCGLRAYEDAM